MSKMQEILLKVKLFKSSMSLDMKMEFYSIRFAENKINTTCSQKKMSQILQVIEIF